jgi:hypothetical protein
MEDLLARARTELYGVEPEGFMALRAELAEAAKADGQPAVAKQIAALRKPTRAAWTLNRLSRVHPEAAGRLAGLAADLQRGGDGVRLRELTQARSRLIDELTRQAFAAAGLPAPPASLREDVIATLGAALADPGVAADLAAGTLVRAVQWAGFGLVPLVPGPPASSPPASSSSRKEKPAAAPPEDELARRRQQKILAAEQAVAEATQAASSAARAEQELEDTVRDLEAQLEQARQELAEARRQAYRAESRHQRAIAELDRFRE